MKKILLLGVFAFAAFGLISCGEDEEPLPPNTIIDSDGLTIELEWSTGGSSQASIDAADLDLDLNIGTTRVTTSSSTSSFESVTLSNLLADGAYTVNVELFSFRGNTPTNVDFTVFVRGIESETVLEFTGSFSSTDANGTNFPTFLTITKTGTTYTIQR